MSEHSRPPALRPPEIGELRAFCLAADLGSLGRAAVALRISQPAVSKRLRTLEALAGAELLARSPRGVALTPAGRALYPDAQKLLGQAAAVQRLLGELGLEQAPIHVAVSPTIAEHFLPARLAAYETSSSAPHAPIELTATNSSAVREMLAESRADIGIAASGEHDEPLETLRSRELLDDEIVLAVPQDHLWYQREMVQREAFLRTPVIVRDPEAHSRRHVDAVLAAAGERLAHPVIEVGSTAVAKREAVEQSMPVLLSALAIDEKRDRLYVRPIEGLGFPRRFSVLYSSEHVLTPSQRQLVDFLAGDER